MTANVEPQVGAPATAARRPLEGIRVLDFTQILAGPFCTRLLADLGAEVLHVETSTRSDRTGATRADRQSPLPDRPGGFHNTNRNKLSITINLKTPEGRALGARLAAVADIIVENFSAGVMKRLELDYERLAPLNPGLIYVSMSGYGHDGPRRDWTSMNMNLQAYTGLMMATGAEGDPPTAISNSWNDYMGGLHAAFGILQALTERRATGRGANLDLAQFESSVSTLGALLLASAINGRAPRRMGNRSDQAAPQGCYRCAGKDDWCVISVQADEQWPALAREIGEPAWAEDPELATLVGRIHRHDELDLRIERWTRELANTEVERRLRAVDVPAQHVRRIDEIVDGPEPSPVYGAMELRNGTSMRTTRLPFSLGKSAISPPSPSPALGQNTREALQSWLGLSDEEIDALDQAGALR